MNARRTLERIERYPIVITRELHKAKQWLKDQAAPNGTAFLPRRKHNA